MTTKTRSTQAVLKRRIRQFYKLLNERDFERCHKMLDPRVRLKPTSVTLLQYVNSLAQFLDRFGSVKVVEIELDLHLREPSKLYEGRDFAIGRTTLQDAEGARHAFLERWVREDRAWYTRCTGFAIPELATTSENSARVEESSGSRRKRRA